MSLSAHATSPFSSASLPSPGRGWRVLLTVLVAAAGSLLAQDAELASPPGRTVVFSVTAEGTAPFTYEWLRDGTVLPGETRESLILTNVQPAQSGRYSARVSNALGSTVSGVGRLFVGVVPTITTQPAASQTVGLGTQASFTVVATGDPAPTGYQWLRNGATIPGATRPSLVIPAVASGDAGTYTVAVSNGSFVAAQTVTSSNALLNVQKLSQTITFPQPANRTYEEAQAEVTATASSGLPVVFQIVSGPGTVVGNTVFFSNIGTITVRATQPGDADYAPASPVERSFTVAGATRLQQVITFPALGSRPQADPPFPLTASASSGLPVTYSSSNPAVATVSGTTVTLTGVGTTVITARQAGDSNFFPAPEVSQTLTVSASLLNQTITFPSLAVRAVGEADFILTASASSRLPVSYESSNPAVATVQGAVVRIRGAGTVTFTAYQTGNASYAAAAPVSRSLTVNKGSQAIGFEPFTFGQYGTVPAGAAVTLAVAADGSAPFSYQWFKDGVALPGSTAAELTVSGFDAAKEGLYRARVSNAFGAIESDPARLRLGPTLHFSALSAKFLGDAPFPLTASASSGLPVAYTSSNPAVATVANGVVTLVGAGSTTITAVQPGDANYHPAASVSRVLTVESSSAAQTILFSGPGDQPFAPAPIVLQARASSGLPVAFSVVSGPASVSGSNLILRGPGTITLRATQPGNGAFTPAEPVLHTFRVLPNFAAWRAERFTPEEAADPARSGPGAVFGLDDLPNLTKYALGLEARTDATAGIPTLSRTESAWVYTFRRPETMPPGIVAYTVEVSTDLRDPNAWNPAPNGQEKVSTDGTFARWSVSAPLRRAAQPDAPALVAFRLRIVGDEGTVTTPVLAGLTHDLPAGQTHAVALPLLSLPAETRALGRLRDAGPNFLEAASGWSPGAWSTPGNPHYVRVKSGPSAGRVLPVTTTPNTEERVYVDTNSVPLARAGVNLGPQGDAFEILPAFTLSSLFRDVDLTPGPSATAADVVQVWTGASWITFYRNSERNRWERNVDTAASPSRDSFTLRPDRGLLVRRQASGPAFVYLYQAGRVPDVPARHFNFRPGATLLSLANVVPTTLAALRTTLGVGAPGGWRTAPTPETAAATADFLMVWNPTANRWHSLFVDQPSGTWREFFDSSQRDWSAQVLNPGEPVLLRRMSISTENILTLPPF